MDQSGNTGLMHHRTDIAKGAVWTPRMDCHNAFGGGWLSALLIIEKILKEIFFIKYNTSRLL
jgi:hypothetical protein